MTPAVKHALARRTLERKRGPDNDPDDIVRKYRNEPLDFITKGLGQCVGDSWRMWRIVLKAAYGVPLEPDELLTFREVAEREPPAHRVKELWLIIGARGGKDSVASVIAAQAAPYADEGLALRPGERALVACFANDRDQASIVYNYTRAYFESIPSLRRRVISSLSGTTPRPIVLNNSVDIRVVTNSFRAPRGWPIAMAIFDECLAAGTLIRTESGPVPIEDVSAGDRVWTRYGLRDVLRSGMTNPAAPLWRVTFGDGNTLTGTAEHPVFVIGKGFVPIHNLGEGDYVLLLLEDLWRERRAVVADRRPLNKMGPVYNLQVDGCPEFYANGILVHNCAFWRSEDSANPDKETYIAVLRGSSSNTMIVGISTGYKQSGLLYDKWRAYHGDKGTDDILVIMAPTTTFRPTFDRTIIERALVEDPERARAEYLGEWRRDLADYVDREVVEAAVLSGVREIAPVHGTYYEAFCDPSGGQRDSMTLAIAHRDDERGVLDLIREVRAPFRPKDVVAEWAPLLKYYRIHDVRGDRYAGAWPANEFADRGISYDVSELTKGDIYREFLPYLNSGRTSLLDNPRMVNQFCSLDRRSVRGGRDTIDHKPNDHDDLANAVAGALVMVLGEPGVMRISDEAVAMAGQPDVDMMDYR